MWVHTIYYVARTEKGVETGIAQIKSEKQALGWADVSKEIPGFITARKVEKKPVFKKVS